MDADHPAKRVKIACLNTTMARMTISAAILMAGTLCLSQLIAAAGMLTGDGKGDVCHVITE